MRYTRLFSLAVVSVIVVSLTASASACGSVCGDSAPGHGDSCSGTATCGQTCGTFWECTGGTWQVGVADCLNPWSPEPLDAGNDGDDGDADTGSDADADAACDAQGDADAAPTQLQ